MKVIEVIAKIAVVAGDVWQAPQHLLGFIIMKWLEKKSRIVEILIFKEADVYKVSGAFGGVSLGRYIFLSENQYQFDKTVKHEIGHSKQSKMMGWSYLPIVGVASGSMNILTRMKILKPETYYTRWPETWADKLGGVDR